MHEVIKIKQYAMTRHVILKNIATGTIDKCFDESDVFGNDFNFIKSGEKYDCKIYPFGDIVTAGGVICKIIDRNVVVGIRKLIKIMVENDEYYISKSIIENCNEIGELNFKCMRKDLIQVNDIINPRYIIPLRGNQSRL